MTPHIYLSSKDRPNVKAGKLGCLTVQPPHKPYAPNAWAGYHQEDQDHYEQALKDYEAALESAMDSAVKVIEYPDCVKKLESGKLAWRSNTDGNFIMKEDHPYPLENYQVEFKDKCMSPLTSKEMSFLGIDQTKPDANRCLCTERSRVGCKTVALITPLQKEESQEQNALWDELSEMWFKKEWLEIRERFYLLVVQKQNKKESMETTVQQKNEVIQSWLGLPLTVPRVQFIGGFKDEPFIFRYHQDWNLLMDVVEKIDKLYADGGLRPESKALPVIDLRINTSITEVHEAVYQFILWHNQQQHGD